ncbi:hypothetical protein Tco_1560835 [Tanacetum coccineum]
MDYFSAAKERTKSEEVNTGSTGVNTGSTPDKAQRKGKAKMVEENVQTVQKTKKHLEQEKAGFAEEEDWDVIRAKLEANAELVKNMQGEGLSKEDFSKRMVDMINQRKKYFAKERAKAKRSKPMNQTQLRTYMSNYLKNQGTWKLSRLKKLTFEEIKKKFDKLVNQIDTFVPMSLEATKERMKRYSEELQTGTSKKQQFQRKKKLKSQEKSKEDSKTDKEEDMEAIGAIPVATKSPNVVNWKIFQQAMLKDIVRDDLIELYKLIVQKYGANRPEDVYDIVLTTPTIVTNSVVPATVDSPAVFPNKTTVETVMNMDPEKTRGSFKLEKEE